MEAEKCTLRYFLSWLPLRNKYREDKKKRWWEGRNTGALLWEKEGNCRMLMFEEDGSIKWKENEKTEAWKKGKKWIVLEGNSNKKKNKKEWKIKEQTKKGIAIKMLK